MFVLESRRSRAQVLVPWSIALALALTCAGAGRAHAGPLTGDTSAAPQCEVAERLDVMALVYNERKPSKSFAMLSSGRGGPRMVGIGSRVAGRQVVAVLPRALWLGPEDDPCWMPLAHEGKQRAKPARSSKQKKKARKKSKRGSGKRR